MSRFIINADDFGLTDGVTRGIVQAINYGIVSSTTAMACVPGAAERLRRWAPQIPECIGAHLQLTTGRPLSHPSMIPTLCNSDGNFHLTKSALASASVSEILLEWQAQYQFLLDVGIKPTHIDTHHHVHKLPNVFQAFCEMAMHLAIPARAVTPSMRRSLQQACIACPDQISLGFYGDHLTLNSLLALTTNIVTHGASFIEIMCHPGYSCDLLATVSKYTHQRDRELAILCDPLLRENLNQRNIQYSTYKPL